ncbi:MAG: formyl transferase [Pseudomonadota bacterium]
MRIVLLGHRDIASLLALHRLVTLLPGHTFTTFYSDGAFASQKTPVSELDALAAYDAELIDRWRDGEFGVMPVAALSLDDPRFLNAPNSEAGVERLEATSPDLVVSIRYRRILRDAAIAVPQLGVINIHSGLLPDYRGVMATFWAMLNGEQKIGTTIHWIVDGGIDTGPIIDSLPQPLDHQRSYLANVIGLYAVACERLASRISDIASAQILHSDAQAGAGAYFSMPQQADVDAFLEAGHRLSQGAETDAIQGLLKTRV